MKNIFPYSIMMLFISAAIMIFGCAPDSSDEDKDLVHQHDQESIVEKGTVIKIAFTQSQILKELAKRAMQRDMSDEVTAFAKDLVSSQQEISGELRKQIANNQVDITDSVEVMKRWKKRVDIRYNTEDEFLQSTIQLINKQLEKYETTEVSLNDPDLQQFFESMSALNKQQKQKAEALLDQPGTTPAGNTVQPDTQEVE